MRFLTFVFIIIWTSSHGQRKAHSIDLSDSGNVINTKYLSSLDSTFENVRLIGLGESTHGTSEFTTVRGDLFKYLVEKHGYTVFFLEADFNACARVNRYIHGATDDGRESLLEVQLWPWITQELLDLIEYMRVYNQSHDNRLEFVGCDMQLLNDDEKELPRLFSTDPKYSEIASKLPNLKFDYKDSVLLVSKQKEWADFSTLFKRSFPEEETLMTTTITQWFEAELYGSNNANFRDSCMGTNIANYLEHRPGIKGIYFAHNEHIGKISVKYTHQIGELKRAGSFLDNQLHEDYFSIALDFGEGNFNAINYRDSTHVMQEFTLKKNHRKSLSHVVLGGGNKIKFVASAEIQDYKYLLINSIGAIYGKSQSGNKINRYRNLGVNHFDAFIVIDRGSATNLLTIKAEKSNED